MLGFLLSFNSILARQVEIKPLGSFEFEDNVQKDKMYKIITHTISNVTLSVFDTSNRLISTESAKSGVLFTKPREDGRIRIVAKNLDKTKADFSYKCPDPTKEVLGHVGYIKDKDLMSSLTKLLDKFIEDQKRQIERTKEHKILVSKTNYWSKVLLYFELASICICIYIIQRSFVSMFEEKKVV